MLRNRISKLKLYSMGIVVANKPLGDDRVAICPIEDLTMIDGLISKYTQDYVVSLPDISGNIKETKLVGDGHLIAKWIPISQSNRVSPPDVVAGETVLIYQYADTDEYYWDTVFNEPSLRRLERVIHMYCDIKSGNLPYDRSTSYWHEVSTVDKKIQIHTSTSDGEPSTYDVVLDTAAATFTLSDSLGNTIHLDSQKGVLTSTTTSEINTNTATTNIHASVTVNILGTDQVNINTKAAHVAADTVVADIAKTATINASDLIANISGHTTITTPITLVDSDVTVTKSLTVGGALVVGGGMSVSGGGGATVNGSMTTVGGDIVADGISLKTHVHNAPGGNGGLTTVPQ